MLLTSAEEGGKAVRARRSGLIPKHVQPRIDFFLTEQAVTEIGGNAGKVTESGTCLTATACLPTPGVRDQWKRYGRSATPGYEKTVDTGFGEEYVEFVGEKESLFRTACILIGASDEQPSSQKRPFGTFNSELEARRSWLVELAVPTWLWRARDRIGNRSSTFWEDRFHVVLANGEQVKARRGHKTDWEDCAGLADLLRHGRSVPSFIPPRPVREPRDFKPPAQTHFGGHRLSDHHRRMIQLSVEHMRFLEQQLQEIDRDILYKIQAAGLERPFQLLQTILGVQQDSAAILLAEIKPDVRRFHRQDI